MRPLRHVSGLLTATLLACGAESGGTGAASDLGLNEAGVHDAGEADGSVASPDRGPVPDGRGLADGVVDGPRGDARPDEADGDGPRDGDAARAVPDARADVPVGDGPPSDAVLLPADAIASRDAAPPPPEAGPDPDVAAPDAAAVDAARPDALLADAAPPDAAPIDPDAAPAPDAAPPAVPAVALNEIQCHGRDFVELTTPEPGGVDLAGWWMTDDLAGGEDVYVFPADSRVPEGGFLLLQEQTNREDGFTFGLGCDDEVALVRPDGSLADVVTLTAGPAAATSGRLPDGDGPFAATEPTPGAANAPLLPTGGDLFDPSHVPVYDLTIDPAGLEALAEVDPRENVPAQLRITVGGEPGPVLEVGVHLKGRAGSFRELPEKAGFKIDVNDQVAGQRVHGLKTLTLNNMVQDRSMIHEATAYTIVRAMGLPAPRVGYGWVRLNGEDYGLYAHIETYDDVFLDRFFTGTEHLVEGAYGQDLTAAVLPELDVDEGDEEDRAELEALIAALDAVPLSEGYENTQDLIDWPEVLGVMAAETYIGHWDGYAPTRNNWFVHTDDDDRLSLMPWGTDQTFSSHLALHGGTGRLMRTCMASSACRLAYDQRLQDLVRVYDGLDLPAWVQAQSDFLQPWVQSDPKRPYSPAQQLAAVAATLDFLRTRRDEVQSALDCLLGPDADPDADGWRCDDDCAPDDPAQHPGAQDVCGDGLDQDCSGRPDDAFECPDCTEVFLGTHRYLVCTTPRTWAQASTHCAEMGAGPLHIDGGAENVALWTLARGVANQQYWLGLTDLAAEGTFVWADGAPLTYTAWAPGEPNNSGGEDCGHFWSDRPQWNDIPCDRAMGVLCEEACAPGEDRDADGAPRCGDDCNDDDPAIGPARAEVCGDRVDNDCDGTVDEGAGCDCAEAERGGHRYLFCDNARTWADARAACQALGLDLVRIEDAQENGWVRQQALARVQRDIWLGLNDTAAEGTFVWSDGTAPAYTNWNGGEPNDYDRAEDCGEIYANTGRWNDIGCGATRTVVCETPER